MGLFALSEGFSAFFDGVAALLHGLATYLYLVFGVFFSLLIAFIAYNIEPIIVVILTVLFIRGVINWIYNFTLEEEKKEKKREKESKPD